MNNEPTFRIYICNGIHCNANGRAALKRALETALWECRMDSTAELRDSSCQDRCDYGPNIKIWPGPWNYQRLTPDLVRQVVLQHLRDGQPLHHLLTPSDRHRR